MRACACCGTSLEGRNRQARCCSGACRAALSRERAAARALGGGSAVHATRTAQNRTEETSSRLEYVLGKLSLWEDAE
jgi:hypothetical protein